MNERRRRIVISPAALVLSLCGLAFLLLASAAQAHPLGNFTINHYAKLTVTGTGAEIRYVLDLAEIPAYQALQQMGGDEARRPAQIQQDAFRAALAENLRSNLQLTLAGVPQAMSILHSEMSFPPGQGGLPTLRFTVTYRTAAVPIADGTRIALADGNFETRIGWREIVVAGGRAIGGSPLRTAGVSRELTVYPADMLTSPLDDRRVELAAAPWAQPATDGDGARAAVKARDRFAELVSARSLSSGVILISLFSALLLGAFHALSPGHGKTVVGAYLVASRATTRHALLLGTTVTVSHTAGVFLLGFVTLFAERYILPETLFPWLAAISGAAVVFIGITLFGRRLRAFVGQQVSGHAGAEHDHHHGPGGHSHLPPDDAPITAKSLIGMGISGGIVPCPSALVVLLGAIALHRVAFGLALIVAFSVGLAGVLVGIGILMVYARKLFERFGGKGEGTLVQVLPIVSSLLISLFGVGIVIQSLGAAKLVRNGAGLGGLSLASLGPLLTLGLLLGLKHASDSRDRDSVSATIAGAERRSKSALQRLGRSVGEAASITVAAITLIVFRIALPASVTPPMTVIVSLVIAVLGFEMVRRSMVPVAAGNDGVIYPVPDAAKAGHGHSHEHGDSHGHAKSSASDAHNNHAHDDAQNRHHGHRHQHDHGHDHHRHDHQHDHGHAHDHSHHHSLAENSLKTLASSPALALLIILTIPSLAAATLFVLFFALASAGRRIAMNRVTMRSDEVSRRLQFGAGAFSAVFGLIGCVQLFLR